LAFGSTEERDVKRKKRKLVGHDKEEKKNVT